MTSFMEWAPLEIKEETSGIGNYPTSSFFWPSRTEKNDILLLLCYQLQRSGATMADKQKTKEMKEAEMEKKGERGCFFTFQWNLY